MADGMSGKPLWMASTRADMSESLAVAMRTSFHVIDLMSVVAVDVHIYVQRRGIGSSRERRAARISLGGRVVVCRLIGREPQHRPLGFVTRRRLQCCGRRECAVRETDTAVTSP